MRKSGWSSDLADGVGVVGRRGREHADAPSLQRRRRPPRGCARRSPTFDPRPKKPFTLPLDVAPELDRDLLDRQRDRRLGLGAAHHHALDVEVGDQPIGDRRAQPLERPVGALLGDQRDDLADLRVVDRVLDEVGDRRVDLPDLEAQVDDQPLADLALGLGDPVVGVQRQAADLDDDLGVRALVVGVLVVVVAEGSSGSSELMRAAT